MKKIPTKYSGKDSVKFWKLVNSLEDDKNNEELYELGCILQNLEGYVLDKLEQALKQKQNK